MTSGFLCIAKSNALTAISVGCSAIFSIVILILSINQSFVICDKCDSSREKWLKRVCKIDIVGYISPWDFEVTNGNTKYEIACPWRERSTSTRILFCSFGIILTLRAFYYACNKNSSSTHCCHAQGETCHPSTTCLGICNCDCVDFSRISLSCIQWSHLLLGFLFVVMFVLDCDGLNSGWNSCDSEFKTDSDNLIQLSVQKDNGDTVDAEYECSTGPYMWMILLDVFYALFLYVLFRVYREQGLIMDNPDYADSTKSKSKSKREKSSEKKKKKKEKPIPILIMINLRITMATLQHQVRISMAEVEQLIENPNNNEIRINMNESNKHKNCYNL